MIRLRRGPAGAAWLAAGLAAWLLAAGVGPAAGALVPEVRTLANGLRVAVFHDTRLPIVQTLLMLPAGSAYEAEGQSGAARLVADLVRRGTATRDAATFAADVDRLGATVATSAGRDYAFISGAFLARDFDSGLELLGDAATGAIFPDDEFERQRQAQMRTVTQLLLDPVQSADELLWATVFTGGPYARPPAGRLAGLDVIGIDSVRAFYRQHWAPDHAVLAIAGDVDPDSAFAAVQEHLGAWPRRGSAESPGPSPPAQVRIRILDRPELVQSEIRIGMPGPRRGDPDEVPLALASQLLSGARGSRQSLLPEGPSGLRGARALQVPLRDGGLFWVAGAAADDSVGAAVRALRTGLEDLRRRPPDETELAPARRLVANGIRLRLEPLGALITQWCGAALCGLTQDEIGNLAERTDSTRASILGSALERWVDSERMAIVVVGPAERLRPQLEGLGPIEVLTGESMAGRPEDEMPKPPDFTAAQEKKGREILRKLIAAQGGLPALRGIHDSRLEADVILSAGGQSVLGEMIQIREEPFRMVNSVKFSDLVTQQVLEDRQGWTQSSAAGKRVQDLDTLSVAALRSSFRSDVPHILQEAAVPTNRVGHLGRDWLDERPVEKVEVRDAAGVRRILYIEVSTQRLAGLDFNEDPTARSSFGARRIYRDYRAVGGVWWPFQEERWLNGERVMQLKYTRVDLNKGVEKSAFARPEQPLPPPSR